MAGLESFPVKQNPIFKCFVSLLICLALSPSVTLTKGQQTETGELFPVLERGKWGFIDRSGKMIIKPQFDEVHPPYADPEEGSRFWGDGLAPVRIHDKWGFVDQTGKLAIKPQFETVGRFYEGFAEVQIYREDP